MKRMFLFITLLVIATLTLSACGGLETEDERAMREASEAIDDIFAQIQQHEDTSPLQNVGCQGVK